MELIHIREVDTTKPIGRAVKQYGDDLWWHGFFTGVICTSLLTASLFTLATHSIKKNWI